MTWQTWIALLRGINVGGKNLLPMKDLRSLLEEFGLHHPRTYIQSGNCVFESDREHAASLGADIAGAVAAQFAFRPAVIVLSKSRFSAAIAANPWAGEDPKTVHLYFPEGPIVAADMDRLEGLRAPDERFALTQGMFYLHAPQGIGRSKLAAQAERHLHVPVTARNLRTVLHIAALAEQAAE